MFEHVLPLSQQVNHEGVDPYFIDRQDTTDSNWIKFVNIARHEEEQNVIVYKYHGNIYYHISKTIPPASELLVGYGQQYVKKKIGEVQTLKVNNICCISIQSVVVVFYSEHQLPVSVALAVESPL